MTLWGSQTQTALSGITGNGALASTAWVPGNSPRRLASNALIDVQSDARGNMPPIGGGQGNDRPIGPFCVTLSPITTPQGAPLALATGTQTAWRKLVARVVMGRGGTKAEAWVDWPMGGGSFVIACDTLSVNAMALDPDPALPTEPQTWDVRCGAWATPQFTGRGSLEPRYTVRLPVAIANAGGTSGEIFVPPFARRWQWRWNNTVGQGAWSIAFLYRRYGVTFAQDVMIGGTATRGNLDATIPGTGWDLPTEATSMVVNNNTVPALSIADGRIEFALDLS